MPSAVPTSRNPIVRLVAWHSRRMVGRVPDPVAVTGHHPLLLAGYGALELASDRAQRVEFCLDIGSMVARRAGATERQLLELGAFRDSDAFSDDERLVLEYAEAMTATPAHVPAPLFSRLRARFDDAQLVELTAAVALENYRGRFNRALGMRAQGFSEGAVCARAEVRTSSSAPAGSVPGT